MKTNGIIQHIETYIHPSTALSADEFLTLLKEEENFFAHEAAGGEKMLTHLRKIFYGTSGWDNELIRGGSDIVCHYEIKVVSTIQAHSRSKHRKHNASGTLHNRVEVLVRTGDWMNPNAGTAPDIYKDNHQEAILPDGLICDIGHVLAGMDALSYPAAVAPLPDWMMWLYPLVPHVDSNADAATWIGDLSSVTGEIFFFYIENKKWPSTEQIQAILDEGNPAPDMLGNIDSLAVRQLVEIKDAERTSDILNEYFLRISKEPKLRYKLFCKATGIEIDQSGTITNRNRWIAKYKRQLKACTAFYVANGYTGAKRYWYALILWLGCYNKKIMVGEMLELQLNAIEQLLKK